jgi:hypothetical protein
MYERVSRELERERAAARTLRRELDSARAETAEQRRSVSAAVANGTTSTQEAPLAATAAGRQRAVALRAPRAAVVPESAPARRVEAMRHAAAARVPEPHHSTTGVWAVRGAAVVLVALLLIALLLIVSAVA